MPDNMILIALNAVITLLMGVILAYLRSIKASINKLWGQFDDHRLDREIHPDMDRIRRIEGRLNGRIVYAARLAGSTLQASLTTREPGAMPVEGSGDSSPNYSREVPQ